jgi:hypothetical protein
MLILLLVYLCNSEIQGELHLVVNDYGAKCLDGSPPAYYLAKGVGVGINKWLIYHMGGSWCVDIKNCYDRSKTFLGSTDIWWPRPFYDLEPWGGLGGGYFSNDSSINPLMWNWNKVFLIYCDGGSFSGNNHTKTIYNNTEIFFRGFLNLQSYYKDLTEKHNLHDATDVVISGASAGGLSTFLHLDWWKSQIINAKIMGLPDGGFFPDKMKFSSTMRFIFNLMNCSSGVNQRCIESNILNKSNCIFPEYTIPCLSTSIFVVQSRFDSWQIGVEYGTVLNPAEINEYGDMFQDLFTSTILRNNKNGVFLDSCYHHSTTWNLKINNTTVGIALKQFYDYGYPRIYIQNNTYICNECC